VKIYKTKKMFEFGFFFLQKKETNPSLHEKGKIKKFEFDFCFYERPHDVCAFPCTWLSKHI
jgi:hypothetical protein